jgi:hypothetical protein
MRNRAGIKVGTERLQTTTRLTLEFPDGQKDNPWAGDVIRELQV